MMYEIHKKLFVNVFIQFTEQNAPILKTDKKFNFTF